MVWEGELDFCTSREEEQEGKWCGRENWTTEQEERRSMRENGVGGRTGLQAERRAGGNMVWELALDYKLRGGAGGNMV